MSQSILNIDLDGPVFDFTRSFARTIGRPELPVPTQWDFWHDWGMTKDEWLASFRWAVKRGMWSSTTGLVPGAAETLADLRKEGFYIRILTTRLVFPDLHYEAVADTIAFLSKAGIEYDSLCMIGPRESKANYEAKVLIDDNVENLEEFTSVPGRFGIVYDRPWNQHLTTGDQISRHSNWGLIYDFIWETFRG